MAAYVSGLVVIWNLNTLGNAMFESTIGGVRTIGYVNMIHASSSTLTRKSQVIWLTFFSLNIYQRKIYIICCVLCSDVDLHHGDTGRDRWLVTSSLDRRIKFYDLDRLPFEVMNVLSKSRCISGVWPLNWSVFLSACDESFSIGM